MLWFKEWGKPDRPGINISWANGLNIDINLFGHRWGVWFTHFKNG